MTVEFEFDRRPATSAELADLLRSRIESGEYPPGARLPSVSRLVDLLDMSNTTIQKTYRQLESTGLIESRPGRGVYVRHRRLRISRSADYIAPVQDGDVAPYKAKSRRLEVVQIVPPSEIAEVLGLEPEVAAVRRSRIMVDEGAVLEIAVSYYPVDVAQGSELARASGLKGGSPSALRRLGFPPRRCREWVEVRMPSREEARELGLSPGIPVFHLLRVTYTDADRPVEALDMVFGGDRYKLEYDLPVVEHG